MTKTAQVTDVPFRGRWKMLRFKRRKNVVECHHALGQSARGKGQETLFVAVIVWAPQSLI